MNMHLLYYIILIILIIFMTVLCIYLYKNIKSYKNVDENVDKNVELPLYINMDHYRLGDVVRFNNKDKHEINNSHLKNFPDTIASEYIKKSNYIPNNYDVLLEIIEKKSNSVLDKPNNEAVIHLRVGDVIEFNKYPVEVLLNEFKKFVNVVYYILPLWRYEQEIPILLEQNIKDIVIVAGAHIKSNYYKSTKYIYAIKYMFEKHGFNVKLLLGRHPDIDLMYMVNSKYLIPSLGGFSELVINLICKKNNNIDATVVYCKGYKDLDEYSKLIERNKCILKQSWSGIYDHIIFHPDTISKIQQEYIIKNNSKNIQFITVNMDNDEDFWSYKYLEYCDKYDSIFRIDEECMIMMHLQRPYYTKYIKFASPFFGQTITTEVSWINTKFWCSQKENIRRIYKELKLSNVFFWGILLKIYNIPNINLFIEYKKNNTTYITTKT